MCSWARHKGAVLCLNVTPLPVAGVREKQWESEWITYHCIRYCRCRFECYFKEVLIPLLLRGRRGIKTFLFHYDPILHVCRCFYNAQNWILKCTFIWSIHDNNITNSAPRVPLKLRCSVRFHLSWCLCIGHQSQSSFCPKQTLHFLFLHKLCYTPDAFLLQIFKDPLQIC